MLPACPFRLPAETHPLWITRGSRVVFGGPPNTPSVEAAVSAAIRVRGGHPPRVLRLRHRSPTLFQIFGATFLIQLCLTITKQL
jgi:hypothetical protein